MQDAHCCFSTRYGDKDVLVAIVSDGAGSASHGGQGASLVCRSISSAVRRHLTSTHRLPSDEDIANWLDQTRDLLFAVAERRGLVPRDFAATLVCAVSDASECLVAHVGDGCVVMRDDSSGEWVAPIWPDHGEYASTTSFVTDDVIPTIRVTRHRSPAAAIALFSDGLERLALDFTTKRPFAGFLDVVVRPVLASEKVGRDAKLSVQLKEYLESSAVNGRTDDDKTLVIAVRK
jgi:hypothetical protein